MKFKHVFKTALGGLKAHISRSVLTILGIVIGITAIILVMAVGEGAKNLILNQIRGLGSQTIIIEPGREPRGPSSFAEIFTDSLKPKDIEALKNPANVKGIRDITPVIMQVASISSDIETVRENVIGASDLIVKILEVYPSEGIFFSDEDIKQKNNVAVIGAESKNKLFGQSRALGEKIKIKGKTFRVVGTLPPKGQVALFNVDNMVAVPYTTAQQYLTRTNHFNSIIVRAESEDILPQTVQSIKLTLRETHGISDPDKDDFHVTTQADAALRVSMVTDILTALLTSIAAISLIVGGIGIMNIMLVSVTERTREIGLRKALGATERDIMKQFLFEAIILTAIGGIIGIILGIFFSFIASLILSHILSLKWEFALPFFAMFLGFGVSSVVGLIFGIYPARQASLKNPIDALRYE